MSEASGRARIARSWCSRPWHRTCPIAGALTLLALVAMPVFPHRYFLRKWQKTRNNRNSAFGYTRLAAP